MSPPPLQSLLHLLFAGLLASVVGAVSYAWCRVAEKRWSSYTPMATFTVLLVGPTSFQVLPELQSHVSFPVALSVLLFSFAGGWFHRRSGGVSKSWGLAGGVVALSALTSIICGITLGYILFGDFWSRDPWGVTAYLTGIVFYPILAPLALWIWQGFRIHPGVDEPLSE